MRLKRKISVLMLDDSEDLVHLYKRRIERIGPFTVTIETDGKRAKALADRQLFDLLVIDAKLDYRGLEFGGLRLADDLRSRYGANSILIVSQFITAPLMRDHGSNYEFLEKGIGGGIDGFSRKLTTRMRELCKRQYAFVAMPFSNKLSKVYQKQIKPAIERAGLSCVRVDHVAHNRAIQDVIFDLVEKCKLVVFVADQANPNAYYEAGFADAMRKEVIIVARSLDELRFDVVNRHTITYGANASALASRLQRKLKALCLNRPVGL